MAERVSVSTIFDLMALLKSKDPHERKKAQYELIDIGKPAIQPLLQMVHDPDVEVRREITAILGELADPSAIPSLIDLMDDEAFEVRWRAAESMTKMKRAALIPLLKELKLKKRFSSPRFLEGAHHILRLLNEEGYLGPSVQVLEAFDATEREIAIPWTANKVLETLEH